MFILFDNDAKHGGVSGGFVSPVCRSTALSGLVYAKTIFFAISLSYVRELVKINGRGVLRQNVINNEDMSRLSTP